MLLRQAALSFALWTGRDAPVEAMRAALRAELGDVTDA
jgi:shikimate 5-dehydrogenase